MREDMAQVVIERPRHGSRWLRYHQVRPLGIARQDVEALGELRRTEGMRRPHVVRKGFADMLGPLRKYLTRQVGRPWDKVYSEIRERIAPDSTVQMHILSHLDDIIVSKTALAPDGRVRRNDRHASWRRAYLDESPGQIYVHPVTGIIRRTPERRSPWKRKKPAEANFKSIGPERELWRQDGIWYWAQFATAPSYPPSGPAHSSALRLPDDCFTGKPALPGTRYRAGKRQAPHRDLRRHGLANDGR